MNKNLTNEQLVGSYLDNEMSEIQRLEFENQLLHDSELREEYNLQKDLINGIKEVRRLELKARLDNLPINTPFYQTIGFKSVVVASISAGIGFGAYYFLNQKDDLPLSEIDITQQQEIITQEESIPEIPQAITPVEDEKDKSEKKSEVVKQKKVTEPVAMKEEVKEEPTIIQPNVIEPDVVEAFEEEDFTSEEITVDNQINDLETVKENVESTVEIATVKDKRNKFHYKFFENKLYLLGNFNEMPYEIIELNTSSGKSYFLYYNNSFYQLETDQLKPAPLEKIENDSLVNELKDYSDESTKLVDISYLENISLALRGFFLLLIFLKRYSLPFA